MTLRKLLSVLKATLPAGAGVSKVRVEPELTPRDLVIIETDGPISEFMADNIAAKLRSVLRDDIKVIVLGSELRLRVARGAANDAVSKG